MPGTLRLWVEPFNALGCHWLVFVLNMGEYLNMSCNFTTKLYRKQQFNELTGYHCILNTINMPYQPQNYVHIYIYINMIYNYNILEYIIIKLYLWYLFIINYSSHYHTQPSCSVTKAQPLVVPSPSPLHTSRSSTWSVCVVRSGGRSSHPPGEAAFGVSENRVNPCQLRVQWGKMMILLFNPMDSRSTLVSNKPIMNTP